MAKKSSKHQSKPVNATVPATSQPADTSQVDIQVPAATRLQFFDFITLAAMDDVKEFLKIASTKPEGENLVTLWRRAHSEGYENGRKSVLRNLEKKMDEKYEEGIERGMNLGREEGYTVAKGGFDHILAQIKAREDSKRPITSVSGTQTDLEATTTSVSAQTESTACVSCQTQTNFICNTSSTSTGTQTSSPTTQTTPTTLSPSPAIATSHPSLSALPSSQLPTPTTAVNNSSLTAPNHLEILRKRRYSLSNHTRAAQSSSVTTAMVPARRHSIATSSRSTAASPSKITPKTSNQATFRDQKVPTTSETRYTMSNEVQGCPKTQETKATGLCNDEQTGAFKRAVSSLEHAGSLQNFVRRSKSSSIPSSSPQHVPMSRKPAATSATLSTPKSTPPSPPDTVPSLVAPLVSTTDLNTLSTTTSSSLNHPEFPKLPISKCPSWADEANDSLPIPPSTTHTKHHRDFSSLRSTSSHPFSSLQRRRGRPKNRWDTRHHHGHTCSYQYPQCYHPPYSQPPPAISLDWDQDPRLSDLGNALRALGWVRR